MAKSEDEHAFSVLQEQSCSQWLDSRRGWLGPWAVGQHSRPHPSVGVPQVSPRPIFGLHPTIHGHFCLWSERTPGFCARPEAGGPPNQASALGVPMYRSSGSCNQAAIGPPILQRQHLV